MRDHTSTWYDYERPGPTTDRFYERIGFQKADSETATHQLRI